MEESVKGSNQWVVSDGTFPISSFSLYWLSWTQSFKTEERGEREERIVSFQIKITAHVFARQPSNIIFLWNHPFPRRSAILSPWYILSIIFLSFQFYSKFGLTVFPKDPDASELKTHFLLIGLSVWLYNHCSSQICNSWRHPFGFYKYVQITYLG